MFNKISLKNYRTHRETTIEFGAVTLLIGNNNSGKSNLLAGIQHFSSLVKKGSVIKNDYSLHRYRLAKDEGMSIAIDWANEKGKIVYKIELYLGKRGTVACKEEIYILSSDEEEQRLTYGLDEQSNVLGLRKAIENSNDLKDTAKRMCREFFSALISTFSYHLQPSFLKGSVKSTLKNDELRGKVNILEKFGCEGGNLQELILYIKNNDEKAFSRFTAFMRRFSNIFNGIRGNSDAKTKTAIWEFDLGRKEPQGLLDEFPPEFISDGMLKASAIALLLSIERPTALILLEEIENGINPANIKLLMDWIWQAAAFNPNKPSTQFILTSHSPSVLREFYDKPHCVYVVRLEKRNFSSTVTNLNHALKTLRDIGSIDDADDIEIIEESERQIIQIPKYRLAELWYSGTIG